MKKNIGKLALYAAVIAMSSLCTVFLILGELSSEYNILLVALPLAVGMLFLSVLGINSISQ